MNTLTVVLLAIYGSLSDWLLRRSSEIVINRCFRSMVWRSDNDHANEVSPRPARPVGLLIWVNVLVYVTRHLDQLVPFWDVE